MPRFSGAYTVHDNWVLRGGVGLFYDKPEGNVIFSQVNLPPFVPERQRRERQPREPAGRAPRRRPVLGNINAHRSEPGHAAAAAITASACSASCRGATSPRSPTSATGGATCSGSRTSTIPTFEVEPRTRLLPAAQRANTNFLRPYKGYSTISQRRSDAFSDYNSLQLYLNKRRGDIRYTVSYTLCKATGLGSGNGDNPLEDEGWRPTDDSICRFFVGPTSFDRRHALDHDVRPTELPFLRGRGATSSEPCWAAGRSAARSAGSRASI